LFRVYTKPWHRGANTGENVALGSTVTSLSPNSGEYRARPSIYERRICDSDSDSDSVKNVGDEGEALMCLVTA
jgi:hypothetical protein